MANWSETISSDEMDDYYEYLNNMSEDEVRNFIFFNLIRTDENGYMRHDRTFDKAMRLFQLKKERQLAQQRFTIPKEIKDREKINAFNKKRAFFNGATLEDYKRYNNLSKSEKVKVFRAFQKKS